MNEDFLEFCGFCGFCDTTVRSRLGGGNKTSSATADEAALAQASKHHARAARPNPQAGA
jgi:hypothetical protein